MEFKDLYMEFDIFKINSVKGKEKYLNLISLLDSKEPFLLPDYLDIFSEGLESVICFYYFNEESNSRIVFPVHLKPIYISNEKTQFFDVTTPYGYSGPIFSKEVIDSDVIEFWKKIDSWYMENNVVSEFVRFNLSNNHLNYSGEVLQTMLNIKGVILEEDMQFKSFDRKVRKNVNKAKRENLKSKVYFMNIDDDKIDEFFNIYIETMVRTNAVKKFHYSLEDFTSFIKFNSDYCAICSVYYDSIPIASELVLISGNCLYSFLGGTDEKYFDKRPNDFLKVELINWARNKSLEYYVLGGGYGFEDGIFKYKKTFFPKDVVDYFTGRKIINNEIYVNLTDKVNDERVLLGLNKLDIKSETYFPIYRIGLE